MTAALIPAAAPATVISNNESWISYLDQLEQMLGGEFILIKRKSGEQWSSSGQQSAAPVNYSELAALIPAGSELSVIAEELPLVLLCLPVPKQNEGDYVAVGVFTTSPQAEYSAPRIAKLLQRSPSELNAAMQDHAVWNKYSLLRTAELLCQNFSLHARVKELEFEVEQVSDNLTGTYEEISLLYGLTQNLRLSSSDMELGALALDWLGECVPAAGLGALYLPLQVREEHTYKARMESKLLTSGDFPVELHDLLAMVKQLKLNASSQPFVANRLNENPNWQFPHVENLVLVPLSEGKNLFGWLVAINHEQGGEFGTVEATLLNSVAVILGTHGGNIELYRQQREFLSCVVRSLTSAIDAKDPYTCGHSDRVARVAVRLAQELQCDNDLLNTIYMAGLVHDIGKIGIDDQVLRKPGRLTNAEFEQIKLHPDLGYKILADIDQFRDVLPVILHHHEQWDGQGYPHGLAGEEIPFLARICSVADAYDAMSSDRPYRRGMPDDKVDSIFRAGAGRQWDTRVVDAYFSARDDIREISRRERANLTLDVQQWARLPASSD